MRQVALLLALVFARHELAGGVLVAAAVRPGLRCFVASVLASMGALANSANQCLPVAIVLLVRKADRWLLQFPLTPWRVEHL